MDETLPNLHQWLPLLREALAQHERFRWPLRGTSMIPTLPPDCEIEIVMAPAVLPLGALLVFANGPALVSHRLVHRAGPFLVAQGDNRREPDRWLRAEQVLGVVAAAFHQGRQVWPGRFEPFWRRWWVLRARALWLARRLRGRRRAGR